MAKNTWEATCKARRSGIAVPEPTPLFETWHTFVDENEDTPERLLDLTIWKTEDTVSGHFNIIYLARGNTYMAGEFSHPSNQFDADVKLKHWEMQWGIRSSLIQQTDVIMTYLNEDGILWRDLNHVLSDLPLLHFRKQ
jgi:hypothetical protein